MRRYTKSFNGFASMLTHEEAKILSSMDEVVSVFPSKDRRLHTTRSWNFLGFPSSAPRAALESDVIIGMIDSGIWPESKSFDDTGFGPPPSKWKGVCDSNHNFTCNNKIIGARYYHFNITVDIGDGEILSPRDSLGHGTHTSSTAAGIGVPHANYSGIAEGTARGGAPSARIAIYKVCWNEGICNDVDVLSAFDDAIADGVDIISISLGSQGIMGYFEDTNAIGSFHAMKKNILTSSSGGNSGPNSSTIENYAPWLLTVAASTIDRNFVAQTQLGDGQDYKGLAINTVGLNGVMYPLIYGGDAPNASAGVSPSNSSTCAFGTLDGELVKGKVVLCSEVRSGLGPQHAGAVGAIMQTDDGPYGQAHRFWLPVVVLGSNDTTHILNYVKKSSNPMASISKSVGVFNSEAPYVISFSSRGPNPVTSNILKPDLAAPGVNILAAWTPSSGEDYAIISGTSMACPHASGAAAYVKSFNPTWSPAAIKSALITTAHVMSPTKNVDAEFAYGAGQLNPLAAVKPGLVYDVDEKDYIKMLCAEGYNTTNLRAVTGDSSACTSATNATVLGLNYPSVSLLVKHGIPFSNSFQRTVTNVGKSNSIYKATISAPASIKISVESDILSFEALLEKKSFLVKIEGVVETSILSASLIWSDGVYNVRSPIVVYTQKE
ncbi:hypothetical protein KSP39_PZI013421 [Platanthera zijinensis]|uniref:Cucumisin n=1 Tax=Platanthera zijinensis TaxID=2320716 RepID=A0AAP0BDV1_9ASPA